MGSDDDHDGGGGSVAERAERAELIQLMQPLLRRVRRLLPPNASLLGGPAAAAEAEQHVLAAFLSFAPHRRPLPYKEGEGLELLQQKLMDPKRGCHPPSPRRSPDVDYPALALVVQDKKAVFDANGLIDVSKGTGAHAVLTRAEFQAALRGFVGEELPVAHCTRLFGHFTRDQSVLRPVVGPDFPRTQDMEDGVDVRAMAKEVAAALAAETKTERQEVCGGGHQYPSGPRRRSDRIARPYLAYTLCKKSRGRRRRITTAGAAWRLHTEETHETVHEDVAHRDVERVRGHRARRQQISRPRLVHTLRKQSSGGVESITTGTGGEQQLPVPQGDDGSQMGEAEEFLG
jgi:hypothetical protein